MACACKGARNRATYTVKLPGGLKVTKSSEQEAAKFAAKHPGSTVIKPATT